MRYLCRLSLLLAVFMALSACAQNATIVACTQPISNNDVGTQINGAIAYLSLHNGGIVDATCYSGTIHIKSNIFAGVSEPASPAPITLKLAPATFVIDSGTPTQNFSLSHFTMEGSGAYGTTILYADPTNDIFTMSGAHNDFDAVQNLVIQRQVGVGPDKTSGAVFNVSSEYSMFRNIKLLDPYNGFFVSNAFNVTFEDISIFAQSSLHSGVYLYGNNIDNYFSRITGGAQTYGDAFIHIRNRTSGIRFTDISSEALTAGAGIVIDCGSDVSTQTPCSNGVNTRPELLHFEKVFIEAGVSQPAILVSGGQDIRFSNNYLASSLVGLKVVGEATAVYLSDSYVVNMQHQCVDIANGDIVPGWANVVVQGNEINACSQAANLTYPAIELEANVNNIAILGNRVGKNTFTNFAFDSPVAVRVDGAHSKVRILDNDFTSIGVTGGSFYTSSPIDGASATDDVWLNNAGNPASQVTSGSFASVASQQGFSINGVGGFTGTANVGGCHLTIQGGIITGTSGC